MENNNNNNIWKICFWGDFAPHSWLTRIVVWHVINANVMTDWYAAAKTEDREAKKPLSNPIRGGWLTFPTLPFWTRRMDTAATSFFEVRGCLFDHKPHRIACCVAPAGWRPQGGQSTNPSCYATVLHSHTTAHICQRHECTSVQNPLSCFNEVMRNKKQRTCMTKHSDVNSHFPLT